MEAQQRAAEEAQRRADAQQRAAEVAQRRAQQAAEEAQRRADAQQRAAEEAQRRAQQASEEAQRRADAQQRAAEDAQRRAQQAANEAAQRSIQQQRAADEAQRRAQQAAEQSARPARDQQQAQGEVEQKDPGISSAPEPQAAAVTPAGPQGGPQAVVQPPAEQPAQPALDSERPRGASQRDAWRRDNPRDDKQDDKTDGPKPVKITPVVIETPSGSSQSETAATSSGDDKSSTATSTGDVKAKSAPVAAGAMARGGADAGDDWQPERELVAAGLSAAQAGDLAALGFAAAPPVPLAGSGTMLQRLRVPSGMSREEAQAVLTRQMPLTRFAPNQAYKIFSPQDGSEDVQASGGGNCRGEACFPVSLIHWRPRLGSCASGVKIGLIDTSFDTTLPIFAKIKASHGEFLNGEKPTTSDWHGTAVLSLLAGDPKNGIQGLVPDAKFFLATAFRTDEHGNASTDTVRLLAALDWLDQLGVTYVNMSFSGPRDSLVEGAIRRMHKKGVVFIAAAGNQGPTAPPSYPAAYPEVIAVTAVNRNGENYRHANRGTYIDFAAPGVDVLTSQPGGSVGLRTGTSFAAPFVTAIVATRGDAGPQKAAILADLTTQDLGPPGRDPIYGQGLALAPEACGRATGVVAAASPRDGVEPPASGPVSRPVSVPAGSVSLSGAAQGSAPASVSGGATPAFAPMSFGSAFAP